MNLMGISGARETRPELNRLMADAHRRKFDAVVVWKFDRFARSVSHTYSGHWKPSRPWGLNSSRSPSRWTPRRRQGKWCSPYWAPSQNSNGV